MKEVVILKSKLLEGKDITVVYENDGFYVGMVADVSPFLIVDEVPNYFIFNRQTAKIEGMSNSLKAAKAFVEFLGEMVEDDIVGVSDTVTPPMPVMN